MSDLGTTTVSLVVGPPDRTNPAKIVKLSDRPSSGKFRIHPPWRGMHAVLAGADLRHNWPDTSQLMGVPQKTADKGDGDHQCTVGAT